MNRIITLAAAALVTIGGAALWQTGQQKQSTSFQLVGMAEAQTAEIEADTSLVKEMSLGNPDAKVTVIEYASFTCPHCKNFHANVLPDLKKNYIDTGKINFIYREVYFDRFGLWAGMVARCAEDKYFGISDMIYNEQSEWTAGENPGAVADNLSKIGRKAGLTSDEIDACLRDEKMAVSLIKVFEDTTAADGVNSTPTFIINGEKNANMSYADFSAILDAKLAE